MIKFGNAFEYVNPVLPTGLSEVSIEALFGADSPLRDEMDAARRQQTFCFFFFHSSPSPLPTQLSSAVVRRILNFRAHAWLGSLIEWVSLKKSHIAKFSLDVLGI